jgi:urease accessory protein
MAETTSLLRAIWQADAAFPSGSFAFSYGLEALVAQIGHFDIASLRETVETILRYRWVSSDRIAMVKAFRADFDLNVIASVDREVEASTFGETLRVGSRRHGKSFLASHSRVGSRNAITLREAVQLGTCLGHISVMQGAVWRGLGLDEAAAQLVSGYGVASNAISAAIRLGALGALEGQTILMECLPLIAELASRPVSDDAQLSSFVPFLEATTARHTSADVHLFAN